MKYLGICYRDQLIENLTSSALCRVAQVPLPNLRNQTEYWISEDGKSAFVVQDICGRCFFDRIRIWPAGTRSTKSRPFFKYRTKNNTQIICTIDRAVYGAFINKNQMPSPREVISLVNWNLNDCSLANIITEDALSSRITKNLFAYCDIYKSNFRRMVDYCEFKFGIDRDTAQDIVAEAFYSMCESSNPPKRPCAVWLMRVSRRTCYRCYKREYIPIDDLEKLGIEI